MTYAYSTPLALLLGVFACIAGPPVARADTVCDFSVYASGAATTTRVTAHGRAAIGGASTFTNMVIGDQLSNSLGMRYDLINGGALTYNSGTVNNGNVLYGAALTVAAWTSTPGNGAAVGPLAYDFTSLTNAAVNASNTLSLLTDTGTVTAGATLLLTGTNNTVQDVFNVTAAQFDGATTGINILNVAPGAQIIVNVDGPGHTMTDTLITNVGSFGSTYFNFNDPAGLTFTRVNFPGTILAPNAAITLTGFPITGSTIEGSLWVNTITATDYIIGNSSCVIPLPSGALMMVPLLVGMVAIRVVRRHKAAVH